MLLAMLAGVACKPRQKVCETVRFFRVLDPPPDAGMPFSIDRLGPELKENVLVQKATALLFKGDTPVRLEWTHADLSGGFSITYSEKEGLARPPGGDMIFPIKQVTGVFYDRVHLGFRTTYCVGTDFYPCPEKEIYVVADMVCRWESLDE